MELANKRVVITGAASGIGRALCQAMAAEGAAEVICVDIDLAGAQATADVVQGTALHCDVGEPNSVEDLVAGIERDHGPIDLFASNAGIAIPGGVETSDAEWDRIWQINVMAHARAARVLVPRMATRGGGYLLNTASAAGLLNQIGALSYGVTKHAAIGLAEWLSISHGDQGIRVSVLCPQAVRSEMTRGQEDHVAAIDGMISAEACAQAAIEGIRAERFLILPHPQVLDYMRNKTGDYDRWLAGMRKLHRRFGPMPPVSASE